MGKKLLAYSLLWFQLFSILFLYSVPSQVIAQNPTKLSSRLTIPVAPHGVMVIQNIHGTESQRAIVSDVLSSTKFSIATDGTITSTDPYYPYGNQVKNSTNINPTNRYYTGQRKVVEGDTLYNYNARFYNPDIGIFTQPDVAEGFNRFAYVGGNPIINSDPTGHISTDSRGSGYQVSSKELLLMPSYENRLPVPGNPAVYTEQIWADEKEAAVRDMKIVALGAPVGALVGYSSGPAMLAAGTACVASLGPCLMGIGDGLMMATGASTIPSFPVSLISMRGMRGGASEVEAALVSRSDSALEAASPMYKSLSQLAYENPVGPHLPTLENDIARGVNSFIPNEGMKVRRLTDLIIPGTEGRVSSLAQRSPAQGKHIFVMTTDGEIIVAKRSGGSALSPHTSLAGGSPVVSAGNIIFSGGRIVAIDAHSGHYRPPISSLSAVWDKVEELGVAMFVPKDVGEAAHSVIHHFHH